MRSFLRVLLLSAVFVLAFTVGRAGVPVAAAPFLAQFGGAVLVGDGEVFAGESLNQFRPGTVYVFRKNGASWVEAAQITAPKSAVGVGFGSALAIDGSTLCVAAGGGAIHLFTKQGANWTHASTIDAAAVPMPPAPAGAPAAPAAGAAAAAPQTPPPNVAQFGSTMAASGEWLLVGKAITGGRGRGGAAITAGAPGRGGAAAAQPSGAVFAFKRSANGQYAYHSTIASAADAAAAAGDRFGSSIAMAGNAAIIGAAGQASGAGIVHEFNVEGDAWKSVRTFAPVGVQGTTAAFGSSVFMMGDQAIVSAPGEAGGYGSVYVFRKVTQPAGRAGGAGQPASAAGGAAPAGNVVWTEVARLAAPAGGRGDRFGTSVAAADREVWVGAPGAGGAGRVFVFSGGAGGFQIDGLRLLGPEWSDPIAAGTSISVRGNVAAVGATGANRGGGGVLIYERDAFGGWREQPMMTTPLDELPAITGGERRCGSSGKIEVFDCAATDLQSFLPPSKMTPDGHYIALSSLWGYTEEGMGDRRPARWHDVRGHHESDAPARCRVFADDRRRTRHVVA